MSKTEGELNSEHFFVGLIEQNQTFLGGLDNVRRESADPAEAEGEEDDEELGTTKADQCSQHQHLVTYNHI